MVIYEWIEIIILLLVQSFTFQLKTNSEWLSINKFSVFVYISNEGRESKIKNFDYGTHLSFLSFFRGKNVYMLIYTRVDTVMIIISKLFFSFHNKLTNEKWF